MSYRVCAICFSIFASGITSFGEGDVCSQDSDMENSVAAAIQEAYKSSTTATTAEGFTKTINLCDAAMELKVSDAQRNYLKQLKSWGLVSRAKTFIAPKGETEKLEALASKAIDDCTAAIELDEKNWKAYAHRAKRYSSLGQAENAIQDLGIAIRRKPDEANLWFNRAELYFDMDEYEVAVADYTEALKLEKGDVQSLTGRAHCYFKLKRLELALNDYDSVLKRTQKNAVAFLNRADLHLAMGNFKLAGEDYRHALERDQKLAQAYRGVAWMYATSQTDQYFNATVADRTIKRAIELDGKETPENLVILAAAQAAAGDYQMARDTMKRVRENKQLSNETREKLEVLEKRKWYIARTGK